MKRIIAVSMAATLAACGTPAAEEPVEEEVVEEAAEDATANDMSGTYSRTDEEGVARSTVLNADGTWASTEDGEPSGSGTWTNDEENGVCFSEEGEDDACFITGDLTEDGTMEVTDPEGETYTVTRSE